MVTTYVVSKTKWKDTDATPRTIESKLESITLYSYYYQYKSGPEVTEILDNDIYITFISGKDVKRFRKDSILWMHYQFKDDVNVDDFVTV